MSATLDTGSRRTQKATCQKCNRTVVIVTIAGAKTPTDPELISVVPFEAPATSILARQLHAERCVQYQSAAAVMKARAEMKRAAANLLKKPKNGAREPGQ